MEEKTEKVLPLRLWRRPAKEAFADELASIEPHGHAGAPRSLPALIWPESYYWLVGPAAALLVSPDGGAVAEAPAPDSAGGADGFYFPTGGDGAYAAELRAMSSARPMEFRDERACRLFVDFACEEAARQALERACELLPQGAEDASSLEEMRGFLLASSEAAIAYSMAENECHGHIIRLIRETGGDIDVVDLVEAAAAEAAEEVADGSDARAIEAAMDAVCRIEDELMTAEGIPQRNDEELLRAYLASQGEPALVEVVEDEPREALP